MASVSRTRCVPSFRRSSQFVGDQAGEHLTFPALEPASDDQEHPPESRGVEDALRYLKAWQTAEGVFAVLTAKSPYGW